MIPRGFWYGLTAWWRRLAWYVFAWEPWDIYAVHWLDTNVKRGTPRGDIACDARVSPDIVVTVYRPEVTCTNCERILNGRD